MGLRKQAIKQVQKNNQIPQNIRDGIKEELTTAQITEAIKKKLAAEKAEAKAEKERLAKQAEAEAEAEKKAAEAKRIADEAEAKRIADEAEAAAEQTFIGPIESKEEWKKKLIEYVAEKSSCEAAVLQRQFKGEVLDFYKECEVEFHSLESHIANGKLYNYESIEDKDFERALKAADKTTVRKSDDGKIVFGNPSGEDIFNAVGTKSTESINLENYTISNPPEVFEF